MVILILIVFGLCFGSFVNALVWRLHEQNKLKAKSSKPKVKSTIYHLPSTNYSILHGRSICPNCRHQLAAKDLLPVISWLGLKGKCRYCGKPISVQYPIVELATVLLFLVSYFYWPMAFSTEGTVLFIFWLIFSVSFVALTVYDIKWQILPDKIVYPMIWLAAAQSIILLFVVSSPVHQLISLLISVLIGGGIFYAIFQVSYGKWIGGGDVKLGFLLGLILADGGLMLLTIFGASILGSLLTVPLMISGKANRHSKIPFGPFLIAGAIFARLFGSAIITWYNHNLF